MKNRKREICTSGSVRDEDGNILIYSANDREDRGNVGIIRSPVRASILPDHKRHCVPLVFRCSSSASLAIGARTRPDHPVSGHGLISKLL
jgi:hypothetical protein